MLTIAPSLANQLRNHPEPALRYFALTKLFHPDGDSQELITTSRELPDSKVINQLIHVPEGFHPYHKWQGAHWALTMLAEIGFPYSSPQLVKLQEQVYAWLFSARHQQSIRVIDGRTRRCASQEGNALYFSVRLNMINDQTAQLTEKLFGWQWPDGGWNCDKKPTACHSSFWETWEPLRGLIAWRNFAGSSAVLDQTIDRGCEVFLKRKLYLTQSTGEVMQEDFLRLHQPSYWKYDILVGLELMRAAGKLMDPRCESALDVLESKMFPDGGFRKEDRQFQASNPQGYHYSPVDWGRTSKRSINYWITVRALSVLTASGRVRLS